MGITSISRYFAFCKIINYIIVITILVFLTDVKSFEPNPNRYDRFVFASYYCQYAKSCIHGGKKVCGYDEHDAYLAQFEDLCTFYKTNCHGVGMFVAIKQEVCDVKKKYLAQHDEEFEWIHVNNSTSSSAPIVIRRKNRKHIQKFINFRPFFNSQSASKGRKWNKISFKKK